MAIDRRLKKKKQREEKQKSRRLQALRELQHEKAEDYTWQASSAFRAQDFRRALLFAQKKLKMDPSDTRMRALAIESAQKVNDRDAFYNLLCQAYEHKELSSINNCLIFGRLAYERKDYRLAKEVYQQFKSDPCPLRGKLTKAVLKEVEQYVGLCETMERAALSYQAMVAPFASKRSRPPDMRQYPLNRRGRDHYPRTMHGPSRLCDPSPMTCRN